jgi:predicted amidohydrolase YtcJ
MHTPRRACLRSSTFLLLLLAASCAAAPRAATVSAAPPSAAAEARLLIVGGRIRVGAPDWRIAEALYAVDGRIVAVGSEGSVRAAARAPFETLDLAGGTAVPGLIDAHGHLEGLGQALEQVDLRGLATYGDLVAVVAARAATLPPGTWIQGRGWDQNLWPEREFPTHALLSEAVPAHPVVLSRVDGHAVLVNARTLELSGLDGPQPGEFPVAGGRMLLGADGRPTGVFVDNAEELVTRRVPRADAATRERRVLAAARELAANGLTGLHDMGEDAELALLLARLSAAGALPLEIDGYLSQGALEGDLTGVVMPRRGDATPARSAPTEPPGKFRVVGAKLYMDGALGSRGAALLEDYADEPGNRGLAFLAPEALDLLLARCDELGLQPAVHAIGDLGNRRTLDGYERRKSLSPRFAQLQPRIEHAQVVAPADWPRFAALGVFPSMQPTHATSDMPWAPARLGAARVEGAYAWRRLDPAGTSLAFGSDCPVEHCDPLAGLYSAVACADPSGRPEGGYRPDQRLDARTALAGFTLNAARAAGQEAFFGTLDVGKFANVTVLDVDPLECAPAALLGGSHVVRTIVRGRTVFERP